jgi:hypothetical protein
MNEKNILIYVILGIALIASVELLQEISMSVNGEPPSDSELASNGYNMSGQTNVNYTELLNNHLIGPDDPEVSCIAGCSLINLTKANENFEIQKKAMDQDLEDYMKDLTGSDNDTSSSSSNDKENLIHSLVNTGKFTEDEAKEFMEDLK